MGQALVLANTAVIQILKGSTLLGTRKGKCPWRLSPLTPHNRPTGPWCSNEASRPISHAMDLEKQYTHTHIPPLPGGPSGRLGPRTTSGLTKPIKDPPGSEACPPELPPEGDMEATPGTMVQILEPQHQRDPQRPAVTPRPRLGQERARTQNSSFLGLPLSLPASPHSWSHSRIPEAPSTLIEPSPDWVPPMAQT